MGLLGNLAESIRGGKTKVAAKQPEVDPVVVLETPYDVLMRSIQPHFGKFPANKFFNASSCLADAVVDMDVRPVSLRYELQLWQDFTDPGGRALDMQHLLKAVVSESEVRFDKTEGRRAILLGFIGLSPYVNRGNSDFDAAASIAGLASRPQAHVKPADVYEALVPFAEEGIGRRSETFYRALFTCFDGYHNPHKTLDQTQQFLMEHSDPQTPLQNQAV